VNILTIDMEDWAGSSLFLLSNGEAEVVKRYLPGAGRNDSQVEDGIRRFIAYLEEHGFKATFFVVGETARAHKALVREIHELGHEIASHGMTHSLLPGLSVNGLERELGDSKKLLEDLTGMRVEGFRAPNLVRYPDTRVFYQGLQTAGYTYDSSRAAGAAAKETDVPPVIREFPVTAVKFLFFNIPLGGTYLKLRGPGWFSKKIAAVNSQDRPAVLYFHPYEMSVYPVCWPHPSPSPGARFSCFLRSRRSGYHMRLLNALAGRFRFTSIAGSIKQK
jgi:peptidoglycan/xylan/chitin deacetylase (PgdA/CDA1 family)